MSRTLPSFLVTVLVCSAVMPLRNGRALAQSSQTAVGVESNFTVDVEPYCSETKLRTSNARIRWSLSKEALEEHKLTTLEGSRQSLETTVYRDGFEKGLMVSVPLTQASAEHPLAALVQGKKPQQRAFQFSVIGLEHPKEAVAPVGGAAMSAVVEGLEPGVNYTWRIAIETDSKRIVSTPTTTRAVVCPADMVGEKPVAKPKPRRNP